jgi:Na+/melibiose symporter-like transporter
MGNSMILGYLKIFLTDVAKIGAGFVGNSMLIARLSGASARRELYDRRRLFFEE